MSTEERRARRSGSRGGKESTLRYIICSRCNDGQRRTEQYRNALEIIIPPTDDKSASAAA